VTNSLKYAFTDHQEPQLSVSIVTNEKNFTVCVEDNGPGFETNPSLHPNTLGMLVISNLSDQLGGKMEFISTSQGTRFCITTTRS
jgi:two-component sensor histidine kinase